MVKGLIPELAVCPFCHKQQFSIHMDPLSSDGKWMYCGSCRFSGDCVELYSRLKGSPDLTVAVRQAITDGYGAVPDLQILGEEIETYVRQFPGRRQEHKDRWNQLRSGLMDNICPDVVNRLQSEHLWGGWKYGYQDRMLRFMGAGLRQEVMDIMGMDNRTCPLPKDMFKTVLALNFQDAPGRICAFMFVGDTGFRVVKELTENVHDGGLAMLDAMLPHEKTVYAVDDPLFALHVQRRQLFDHPEPAKFVVYNHSTRASWSSLSADKVVLWSRANDWHVFNHARRVRNGHVASVPRLGDSATALYDYVRVFPLAAMLRRMDTDAKPWPEAFCQWLTDKNLSESAARDAILKLELTPGEKQLIGERCPKSLYDRVMALMGESRIYVTKILDGFTVTEREDGLYVFRPRSGEERIIDALVKIESEICDKTTGKAVWKGHIRFKGADIPFQAPSETVEGNFKAWLNGCTVRAGLGTPALAGAWVSRMAHAVKAFSDSRSVQSLSHIGVQVNGDVIFPQFKIVDGVIRDTASFFGDDAPATKILPPLSRGGHPTDTCNPARSCWVALAAAYAANLMAEERQVPVMPVILAGPHGSVARTVGRQFAKAADMPVLDIRRGQRWCESVRGKLNVCGYPSYIEAGMPGQLHFYPVANNDNVIIAADVLDAAAMAIGGRWLVIRASRMYAENCLPPIHDVFQYLADLQKRDYDLNAQVPLHEALLEDICDWHARYLGIGQADTLAEARKLVQKQQPAGDCLLDLCYWFYSRGELTMRRDPFMERLKERGVFTTAEGIVLDDDAKKVFLSRRRLFKCITAQQLPSPDVTAAIDDLTGRGVVLDVEQDLDGWVLDMNHWNEQARIWKASLKQTHE